jgi:hypothetical protein
LDFNLAFIEKNSQCMMLYAHPVQRDVTAWSKMRSAYAFPENEVLCGKDNLAGAMLS